MAITDRAYVAELGTPLPAPSGPLPRWITVVATEEAGENVVGTWATIRGNPTNGQVQAISQPNALWTDVGPWLAPLVKAWGVMVEEVTWKEIPAVLAEDGTETTPARRVAESIEMVPLPPPSEAGWEVFLRCDPDVRNWVHEQAILARLHVLGEMGLGKSSNGVTPQASATSSGSTPDGTPDEATSDTAKPMSRHARKSSRTP
jgi:hypothetical protein